MTVGLIIYANHYHAVVTQQVLFDSLSKTQPMEDWSKDGLIVHGGHLIARITSDFADTRCVDPWCCGHKNAPRRWYETVIKNRAVFSADFASAAVCFIGDYQIDQF